uniref:Uncharacterized protein n=1 Tax=Arundo donax TaxID=35708 RepID=A0A0A9EWG9_ARUDO
MLLSGSCRYILVYGDGPARHTQLIVVFVALCCLFRAQRSYLLHGV